jgi:hypothetical protein
MLISNFSGAYCLTEHPTFSRKIYAGGRAYTGTSGYQWVIYESTDYGATWPTMTLIGPVGLSGTQVRDIAFAPGDPSIRYAAGVEDSNVKIRRSDDGVVWTDATGDLGSFHVAYDYVFSVWVSPDDPVTLLAATSKGVFATTDGGASWSATPLARTTLELAYYPLTDTLYAATSLNGVYKSEDRGATWQEINSGLAVLNISCLQLDARKGWLFAGTSGGSVWRLKIDEAPLWVGVDEIDKDMGGTVEFELNAGVANADRGYLLAGTASGTSPGTLLPGGLATIPVNRDWLTDYILNHLGPPVFVDFDGTLDGAGRATAVLNAPPVPAYGGMVMHYAFCLKNPFDYASNAVEVVILE